MVASLPKNASAIRAFEWGSGASFLILAEGAAVNFSCNLRVLSPYGASELPFLIFKDVEISVRADFLAGCLPLEGCRATYLPLYLSTILSAVQSAIRHGGGSISRI